MTRTYTNEIELHADREAVWRALTDAEELSRWLVESATAEPREGGTYRLLFDDGLELRSRIEEWDGIRVEVCSRRPSSPCQEKAPSSRSTRWKTGALSLACAW